MSGTKVGIAGKFDAEVVNNLPQSQLRTRGEFVVQCVNPDGSVAWEERFKNGTTNEGINHALGVVLNAVTAINPWYIGLILTGAVLNATDTYASHTWTEGTSYTGNRQQWNTASGAVTGQSITSNSVSAFPITGNMTVAGAFLASFATKADTAHSGAVLWATGLFSAQQVVTNGQTLNITYTATGTGS